MLWEIIFEMMGELFKALGEILTAFWAALKGFVGYFQKKKDPARQAQIAALIVAAMLIGCVLMFPQIRNLFSGDGTKDPAPPPPGTTTEEKPRNPLPMGQYTRPEFYKKKKTTIEDDNGAKRVLYYYWYEPPGAKQYKYPLVVVLHDKDGACHAAMHLRMGAVQKAFPSFLLIPQSAQGKVWDAPARYSGEEYPPGKIKPPRASLPGHMKSLRDAIFLTAQATVDHNVDQSRMYIVGCDEGASGVYGALANHPGIFAAGIAIAGSWSFLDRQNIAKTPLLIMHGAKDKAVPPQFSNTMARVINAIGGKAAYHEFPAVGHDCDSPYFYPPTVWQWLFAQRRPAPRQAPAQVNVAPAP